MKIVSAVGLAKTGGGIHAQSEGLVLMARSWRKGNRDLIGRLSGSELLPDESIQDLG